MQEEWQICADFAQKTRFRKFAKKHPKEYESCFANLEKIKTLLESGFKLSELERNPSFFRSEGNGLFRIGQSGVSHAKESRLYIYPVEKDKSIHLVLIGTKETQNDDIKAAKRCISKIC